MDTLSDNTREFGDAGLGALLDFSFRQFVTLSVVKVLYALIVLFTLLIVFLAIITALFQGFMAFLTALVVMPIVGAIFILGYRVALELVVVIFRIGENTAILAKNVGGAPPPGGIAPMGTTGGGPIPPGGTTTVMP